MRTLTTLMVSLAALVALPATSHAQTLAVGLMGGQVQSKQIRQNADDSGTRSGILVGAFAEVETPTPFLTVLVEGAFVQRGGTFTIENGYEAEAEADFLELTVAPTLRAGIGPMAAFLYAGPTMEVSTGTRSAAALNNIYANPNDQVFGVTAGAGVEARVGTWVVRGEARVVEELSSSYRNGSGDVRHRSTEILVRIGRHLVR